MRCIITKMGRKKTKIQIEDLPAVTIELMSSLRTVLDDSQFVMGSLRCVADPEDQAALLQFIQNGENVNVSSVALRAYELGCQRAKRMAG